MKATLTGKIKRISRSENKFNATSFVDDTTDMTTVEVDLTGQVEEAQHTAKKAAMSLTLKLKPVIAEKLTFGSTITVSITDESILQEVSAEDLIQGVLSVED
jgi:hypothetical protein